MGRKEENIKKAQTLLHQKERIRNIGTAAHIDHGKCCHGSTRIWVDGRWETAKDLWGRFEHLPPAPNNQGAEVKNVVLQNLWPLSLDTASGKTQFSQITHVWRLPATERLVEIESRDGRIIRTTPEHPFVIGSEKSLQFRAAADLKRGDVLAVPRTLPSRDEGENWSDLESEIVLRIAGDPNFLFKLTPAGERLTRVHGAIRGESLLAGFAPFEMPPARIYRLVESIAYRPRKVRSRQSRPIRLPNRGELEEFFWVAGLLYGDGDGNCIITGADEKLLRRALRTLRKLSSHASITRDSGRPIFRLHPGSNTFIQFMHSLFGYPLRHKAWSIRLPSQLHTAPLPIAAAFIQGYLDADGTVEKARSAVSGTSVSEAFLDDLQLLLLRFGVRAILNREPGRSTLYVSGRRNLSRLPDFSDPSKASLRKILESRSKTSYVVDLLPVRWERIRPIDYKSRFYAIANERPSIRSLLLMAGPDIAAVEHLMNEDVAFVEVRHIRHARTKWVYDFSVPGPKNFVAEGLFVHNTTLSDSLIAGAGMISEELAGSQLFMDYDEQEQSRGITINAAIASMVHDFEGGQYLINLIDPPGHVDFSGDLTRAMRAIDGVIILVDAVEGIMPQTETVIRQALKERVRPVLFINKVDRLVNELKISPDMMQQRFQKIITEVNNRIRKWLPEDLGEKWMVNVEAGSVAFGSAYHKWAVSAPFTKRTGIGFKDVYKHAQEGTMKELAKKAPLHSVVLNMVIRHLPNPLEAQKVRIPIIWKGDLESPVGKAMMTVDENGPVGYMVTKIIVDPQAGEVAAARLFSGKIR